tara:strand:- start:253 stop:1605 length:1353 start_codon:yes stop_codon:yes gene_type:complete
VLAQAATGFGKTICAAWMARATTGKGNDITFTCHRQELVDQTSAAFTSVGVKHGFVVSKMPFAPHARVKVASVGTLKNRLDVLTPPKLLVIDEAHHCAAAGWATIVDWAKAGGAKIVGLTATPWRLSGEGLDQYFDDMITGPSVSWLIENGYLSEYRAFAPGAPDMKGVHSRAGDYVRGEIEDIMDTNQILGDTVQHYRRHARGKKGLVFCVSVRHSEHMAARFRDSGISAQHLDGNTPSEVRRKMIRAYADGHIDVLTNVDLFGEGFDLSALAGREVPIQAVSLCRPTMSLSLFLQQVGRALRPDDEPHIILDHAGNLMRHGFPDDDRQWTLQARKKKNRGNVGAAVPIRQCDHCFYVHRPAPVCPNCGHVYEIAAREVEEIDGDLGELNVRERRRLRLQEQHECGDIDDLIALGRKRGYKHPQKWAAHVMSARLNKSRGRVSAQESFI